jgi:hypothetical protein
LHLGEYKVKNKQGKKNKTVEKGLLPAGVQESKGVTPKTTPSLNRGNGVLLRSQHIVL